MKFCLRVIVIFFMLLSLVTANTSVSHAAVQLPGKVRVGLYFSGSSMGINPASCFSVSAEKGIQIGYCKDGKFFSLVEEAGNVQFYFRKDAYYIKDGSGRFSEYNPSAKTIPEGDKYGPFHIRIGEGYSSLAEVTTKIRELGQKGVDAYAAFNDTWQVWIGFYSDIAAAQKDITDNIQKKLGEGKYSVVEPSPYRITVQKENGAVVLVYEGTQNFLQIHPMPGNNPYMLMLNKNPKQVYRGDLEVRRITDSDMTVVNILPLEEYLYGVVPAEIEADSHPDALKAQAIAARTYAINNIKSLSSKSTKLGFDVYPTVYSQVYKGVFVERSSSSKAVDDTKGKVITYNGRIAEVFFFSSSGGYTEASKNVWSADLPYLQSVEDKYESGKSYRYNWEHTITAAKVKETMTLRGHDLGDIQSITVTKKSEAGRPIELVIQGTKNQRIYTKDGCRTVFSLDSQWYTITTDADIYVKSAGSQATMSQLAGKKVLTASGLKSINAPANKIFVTGAGGEIKTFPYVPTLYKFTGKGWGHAVGLSQEGAKGMALAGFTYDKILEHYFPGTKLE